MKNIKSAQSDLVNDTCNDCGSYADIGAVIDEHDTQLVMTFSGDSAKADAEAMQEKATKRFDELTTEIKSENSQVTLLLNFAFSAEKMIFQLENSI
ncbi:DUF406 family protein [uncultured Shewanella sp.]|uniref:DUF406 family protein n=1 Tax=Shewanella atlantica TaxID=271099 RepID=UPI0026141F5D|nr:DUF406 family protein [uncultured Shewanella sp.]